MKSWNRPEVPRLPGRGIVPSLFDTATGGMVEAAPIDGTSAGLYVCGITPYDSTHLGHANTYLAYDVLQRMWRDAGLDTVYVQNTTDVDDPLLERADATAVDWRDLAATQTERFRGDMEALRILPPDHFIAVTERVDAIAASVARLLTLGIAYRPSDDGDIYFDIAAAERATDWHLGAESRYDRELMLALSRERGGDPDRAGKRDPLDPLLWRGAREGEPSWPSEVGAGRPGWHIECAVIASEFLERPFVVQGGGSDLIFPHHEFSAAHAEALDPRPFARIYSHTGMVAYRGEKMSKSLGNLVFVRELVEAGRDPRAIRLALLSHSYRKDWEWTDLIDHARALLRLAGWMLWAMPLEAPGADLADDPDTPILAALRTALADDLDTPRALDAVDEAIAAGVPPTKTAVDAIDALLGIRL